MPQTQKVDERRDLAMLAEAIGCPQLNEAKDSEHPDFVLDIGDDVLGIEHTVLYTDQPSGGEGGGSPARRTEAVLAEFQGRAKCELLERYPNAEVGVFIDPSRGEAPNRRQIGAAVEQFINLVSPHLFPPAPEFRWCSDGQPPSALAEFADGIRVTPAPGLGRVHWNSPIIGWMAMMIHKSVADHIVEKDEKRRTRYANNCSRAWLLLVATGTSAASLVTLPAFDVSGVPANGFERIYLLDRFSGRAKLLWPLTGIGEGCGAAVR